MEFLFSLHNAFLTLFEFFSFCKRVILSMTHHLYQRIIVIFLSIPQSFFQMNVQSWLSEDYTWFLLLNFALLFYSCLFLLINNINQKLIFYHLWKAKVSLAFRTFLNCFFWVKRIQTSNADTMIVRTYFHWFSVFVVELQLTLLTD